MSNPLPPNPCLVAILLVVKMTSEPYIAFHYPPRPGEDNSRFRDVFKDRMSPDESTTSSSDDESQNSVEEASESKKLREQNQTRDSPPNVEDGSVSPEKRDGFQIGQKDSQWKELFGLPAGVLARLLCPAAKSHMKKFELGIKDQVFIGRPMYARESGAWRKPKKERRSSSRSNTTADQARRNRKDIALTKLRSLSIDEEMSDDVVQTEDSGDAFNGNEEDEAQAEMLLRNAKSSKSPSNAGEAAMIAPISEHILTMFHVVFVLKPPPQEYHLRVEEMHGKIVKKFSKALKLEQARTEFVAKETASIASLTKDANKRGNAFSSKWYCSKD